ncbi:MAG: hypothetical protein FRX49_11842 [Trebouxia sp. A1-2]|nr:MAG: hypothetical protein FRX49_11842 [Trebouxia sp. A1-2]
MQFVGHAKGHYLLGYKLGAMIKHVQSSSIASPASCQPLSFCTLIIRITPFIPLPFLIYPCPYRSSHVLFLLFFQLVPMPSMRQPGGCQEGCPQILESDQIPDESLSAGWQSLMGMDWAKPRTSQRLGWVGLPGRVDQGRLNDPGWEAWLALGTQRGLPLGSRQLRRECKPVEAEECIPSSTSASEQTAAAPEA